MRMSTASRDGEREAAERVPMGRIRLWVARLLRRSADAICAEEADRVDARAMEAQAASVDPATMFGRPAPPEHWLARVRQGAPELLYLPDEGGEVDEQESAEWMPEQGDAAGVSAGEWGLPFGDAAAGREDVARPARGSSPERVGEGQTRRPARPHLRDEERSGGADARRGAGAGRDAAAGASVREPAPPRRESRGFRCASERQKESMVSILSK